MKIVGCSVYQIGSERHVRGDIIEIPESMFEADLHEVVEPKPKRTRKSKKTPVATEELKEQVEPVEETSANLLMATSEETEALELTAPEEPVQEKKKRRRKKS